MKKLKKFAPCTLKVNILLSYFKFISFLIFFQFLVNKETLTNIFLTTKNDEEEDFKYKDYPLANSNYIEDKEKEDFKKSEIYLSTDNTILPTNDATSTDEVEKISSEVIEIQDSNEINHIEYDQEEIQNEIQKNEINEIENSPVRKKKNSLLKRTASEPELSKLDSTTEFKLFEDNTIDKNEYNSLRTPMKSTRRSVKQKPILNKWENYQQKYNNANLKSENEMDSAFNELFFYNFENVLIEFIRKKHKS